MYISDIYICMSNYLFYLSIYNVLRFSIKKKLKVQVEDPGDPNAE